MVTSSLSALMFPSVGEGRPDTSREKLFGIWDADIQEGFLEEVTLVYLRRGPHSHTLYGLSCQPILQNGKQLT